MEGNKLSRDKPVEKVVENKKVKNARSVVVDGIKFKSALEGNCYKRLVAAGFNPKYEAERTVIFEGFRPGENLHLYLPVYKNKKMVGFERNFKKVQSITLSPDFTFEYLGRKIIIETKGNPNDAYPNKRKMYFKVLENESIDKEILFFEPRNISQIEETIKIIKSL